MAVQSKMWVWGHSPAGGMDVCRECCVLSGRYVCVRLITRPLASNKCSKCNYILHTGKFFIYGPLHNACHDISDLFVLVLFNGIISNIYCTGSNVWATVNYEQERMSKEVVLG